MNIEIISVWIAIITSLLIGLWATIKTYKEAQGISEYFTAVGFLDKKRIFFSVFATTFSAFTVVGLPAMFYAHGIGAFWFMWIGIILTPFTMHFIGRKLIRLSKENRDKFASPVGLLTSGYNSKALTIVLSLTTIVVLFPYLILQIAGVGKFLVSISNGSISYILGTLLCCVIVGAYIYSGGAKADAETDLIQGILLVIGTSVVGLLIIYLMFDSDFTTQVASLNEKKLLSIPGPKGYFTIPLLISYGIIFTLISISTPQVSQKLMGIENEKDLKPLFIWYPIVGTIVLMFAGLMGLYAAANLKVSTPDFVSGDVLRSLFTTLSESSFRYVFLFISVLFISGVISAAVSTIDSLLLAITGIIRDSAMLDYTRENKRIFRIFTSIILILGIVLSSKPPLFIVNLAQVQLAGLTSLLPCLLGPLFGVNNRVAGWLALVLGLFPIIANKFFGVGFWGVEIGVVGLIMGLIGLFIGKIFEKS
ncbi:MAG: hypothetical protein SGJ10_05110 [Bacteroidota bacterium]|nr:hypothetical protein [Bacteroidota bacterium]